MSMRYIAHEADHRQSHYEDKHTRRKPSCKTHQNQCLDHTSEKPHPELKLATNPMYVEPACICNHTQTMPTGPAGIEYESVVAIEGNNPIILKAIAKTWTVE